MRLPGQGFWVVLLVCGAGFVGSAGRVGLLGAGGEVGRRGFGCGGATGRPRRGRCAAGLGVRGARLGCWAASRARAPGCAVGSRSLTRRAVSHTSAGRCHSCRRSCLGAALASGPARRCVWNQCTGAALIVHSAAHAQLASQAVKGIRAGPESLRRATASSASACSRMSLSSWAGPAAASVRNPQQAEVLRLEQAALRARVQRLASDDQRCPFWPARQVHQIGQLRDMGFGVPLLGVGHSSDPASGIAAGSRDRGVDACGGPSGHENVTLRSRHGSAIRAEQPPASTRSTISRRRSAAASPARRPAASPSGSTDIAASSTSM